MAVHMETQGFKAGQTHWLSVTFTPKDEWHTYWKNYGDSGATPMLNWSVPDGINFGSPLFPAPEVIPVGPLMNYGYHSISTLLIPLKVAKNFHEAKLNITLQAEWLVCKVECIPQYGEWQFTIDTGNASLDPTVKDTFEEARNRLPEPSYWSSKSTIYNENSRLNLFINPEDLNEITNAYFFPETEGVLKYAAEQEWRWGQDGLSFTFERTVGSIVPEIIEGVLQLDTIDGESLYFELSSKVNDATKVESTTNSSPIINLSMPLWKALLFAILGGIILNLMPCVFPVLSLKAMALVSANYKSKTDRQLEGWAYTFGIWISFMAIVGALVLLRSGGAAIGWGFQLQSPLFIGLLAVLMVMVALSLFGVYHIQLGVEGAGQNLASQKGLQGSFFKGVLATLVATPCTAPLMAPAIGYALTQPTHIIILVFSALAFGLALPFLLLSYSDKMASLMPRPGAWMEKLKQGLGFPMLLTAVWLVYVYNLQAGSTATAILLGIFIIIGFSLWLWQEFSSKTVHVIAIVLLLSSFYTLYEISRPDTSSKMEESSNHQTFSENRLQELLSKEEAVFIYFTAEWCITCKVNERVALDTDKVQNAFRDNNITVLKGDWTNRNDEIGNVLASYGRAGVPFYLYFAKGEKKATILPEILTPEIVIGYLTTQ